MKSQDSRGSGRRGGRGQNRSNRSRTEVRAPQAPVKKTLWQKVVAFFQTKTKANPGSRPTPQYNGNGRSETRAAHKPENVEVTSPKLYVGNLSYEATESDLSELFNGVGAVKNAEVVTHKHNDKSKGFGFVTMSTVDEAKRAVVELHDKPFMGRKLVVSGAKTQERETNYRG